MERSPRNSQPSSRYRKFQAIFASPNRYFTEKSLWVPLHGPRGVHLSQRVDCNNKLVKKQRRVIYTEYFIYQAFSYNVHYQKKKILNRKKPLRKTSACLHPFRGTQREYSSKPHKHSIAERTLVFKRQIKAYFYPLKIFQY